MKKLAKPSQENSWPQLKVGGYLSLYLTYFLGPFGIAVVAPLFAGLILHPHFGVFLSRSDLHFRSLLLGLLIAAFPAAQVLGSPIFAHLITKKKRKTLLLISTIAQTIGWIIGGVSLWLNSYLLLLFSRIMTGFFAGSYLLTLLPHEGHLQKKEKTRRYLYFLLLLAASAFIIGICTGGILTDHHLIAAFTNTMAFWFSSALSLLTFFIILTTFPNEPILPNPKNYLKLAWPKLLHQVTTRHQWHHAMLYTFFFLGYIPFLQFFSYYAHIVYSETKIYISLVLIGMALSYFIGVTLLWRLLKHLLSIRLLALFSFSLLVCFSLLIASVKSLWMATTMHLLLALFAGLTIKVISSCLKTGTPTDSIELVSLNSALYLISAAIAPLICGGVILINIFAIYYTIAICFTLSGFMIAWKWLRGNNLS